MTPAPSPSSLSFKGHRRNNLGREEACLIAQSVVLTARNAGDLGSIGLVKDPEKGKADHEDAKNRAEQTWEAVAQASEAAWSSPWWDTHAP